LRANTVTFITLLRCVRRAVIYGYIVNARYLHVIGFMLLCKMCIWL